MVHHIGGKYKEFSRMDAVKTVLDNVKPFSFLQII